MELVALKVRHIWIKPHVKAKRDQMTACNVKIVARSDELTQNYQQTLQLTSARRRRVLVFTVCNFTICLSLTMLLALQQAAVFSEKL